MIYKSVNEIIGKTPLMQVCNLEKAHETVATVLIKIEAQNPSGSVKDRTGTFSLSSLWLCSPLSTNMPGGVTNWELVLFNLRTIRLF